MVIFTRKIVAFSNERPEKGPPAGGISEHTLHCAKIQMYELFILVEFFAHNLFPCIFFLGYGPASVCVAIVFNSSNAKEGNGYGC